MAADTTNRNVPDEVRALRVALLGTFGVEGEQGPIALQARKDGALLAYLASSPGVGQRRGRLATLLWPDSDDARARESLKKSLLRLRRRLPERALETDRQTVRLTLSREQIDVARLEDEIDGGSLEVVANATEAVTDAYLGGLEDIGGEFDRWRLASRQALLERVRRAALETMNRAVAAGRLDRAETLAEGLARLDPLDEEASRCLIAAYAGAGRVRRATEVYERLRDRLETQLGVAPEAATRALHERLVLVDAQAAANEGDETPRVAVLNFEVGADDRAQRYFAEGLTDDITTDLARTSSLTVLPPSAFAGLEGDVGALVLARGATHLLQGSVRRGGGRLRVNVRLSDARSDRIVWAERYDRSLEGVLEMQDAIASEVVRRLHHELGARRVAGRDSGTRDAEAYDMLHKGRSLYLRGMNYRSLRAARALLLRSVELDPSFARGHAQLAICEACLAMNVENRRADERAPPGLEHARRALERVPGLALGHAAEGLAFYAAGRYLEAERALGRALALDEGLFEAHFFLGRNRRLQGDREEAAKHFRLAAALRTDDYRSCGLLGEELKALGRAEESREALGAATERIEAELERHPDNADALSFGAAILAELDRSEQARTWCAWALAIEPEDSLLRYNVARVHALLGDTGIALEQLEIAYDTSPVARRRLALWMRHDLDFAPLVHERRFRRLLAFADLERDSDEDR